MTKDAGRQRKRRDDNMEAAEEDSETQQETPTAPQKTKKLMKKLREMEQIIATQAEELKTTSEEKQALEVKLSKSKQKRREIRTNNESLLREMRSENASLWESLARLDASRHSWESEKVTFEEELASLRSKFEALEKQYSKTTAKVSDYDALERRMSVAESQLSEKESYIAELETEIRVLSEKLDTETKKTQRIQSELCEEKSRVGDLNRRLHSVATSIRSRLGETSTSASGVEEVVTEHDGLIMQALSDAWREADELKEQHGVHLKELDSLKKELEDLRRMADNDENSDPNTRGRRRSNRKTARELEEEKSELLQRQISTQATEPLLEVYHSEEKGRGIRTKRAFLKDDFVCEYKGELLTYEDAKEREKEYAKDPSIGSYMYFFEHRGRRYCIDGTEESAYKGRLINHSALNPNLKTKVVDFDSSFHLILVAKRDIDEGEELLYDYGDRTRCTVAENPWLVNT